MRNTREKLNCFFARQNYVAFVLVLYATSYVTLLTLASEVIGGCEVPVPVQTLGALQPSHMGLAVALSCLTTGTTTVGYPSTITTTSWRQTEYFLYAVANPETDGINSRESPYYY